MFRAHTSFKGRFIPYVRLKLAKLKLNFSRSPKSSLYRGYLDILIEDAHGSF